MAPWSVLVSLFSRAKNKQKTWRTESKAPLFIVRRSNSWGVSVSRGPFLWTMVFVLQVRELMVTPINALFRRAKRRKIRTASCKEQFVWRPARFHIALLEGDRLYHEYFQKSYVILFQFSLDRPNSNRGVKAIYLFLTDGTNQQIRDTRQRQFDNYSSNDSLRSKLQGIANAQSLFL